MKSVRSLDEALEEFLDQVPTVRVRSRLFNKLARWTKPLGLVTLGLAPQVFDSDQALRFQPRVGQSRKKRRKIWREWHSTITKAISGRRARPICRWPKWSGSYRESPCSIERVEPSRINAGC